tara:strand:+ start:500 stop:697 length:198 start_codon:yes stop_codon:yes gene_type:complete
MYIDLRKNIDTPFTDKELYDQHIESLIEEYTNADKLHERHLENQRQATEEANVKKALQDDLNQFS